MLIRNRNCLLLSSTWVFDWSVTPIFLVCVVLFIFVLCFLPTGVRVSVYSWLSHRFSLKFLTIDDLVYYICILYLNISNILQMKSSVVQIFNKSWIMFKIRAFFTQWYVKVWNFTHTWIDKTILTPPLFFWSTKTVKCGVMYICMSRISILPVSTIFVLIFF